MVDTNVVVDLLQGHGEWFEWSLEAVARAQLNGAVAVSAIVVGELAARAMSDDEIARFLDEFAMAVHDFGSSAAHRAGVAQFEYRRAGGKRERLLGDFLIGAHAEVGAVSLVTRDTRRYRRYFPELMLIAPENDDE